MNLKQFKYVLTLANEGTFSKAADKLNITQPSLSQYIKNIEKEIGVTLFERTNGNVRLTDAGRIYIDAGKQILYTEHQMQNRLFDLNNFEGGSLILGISPHRSFHLMPKFASKFKELYPKIKLIVDERSGAELIDSAQHGEFDLFVTTLPIDTKQFDYELVLKEEIILAVPNDSKLYCKLKDKATKHPDKIFPAIDIGLISDELFITLSDYMPMKIIEEDICRSYNINLNYAIECTSLESEIAMVHAGIASALIPVTLSNFNEKSDKVSYFSFVQDIPCRDVVVAWKKDQILSKPLADMIKIMKIK